MNIKVNTITTICSTMSEAVTVSNVMMVTLISSEESLARDRHTHIHTKTQTQTQADRQTDRLRETWLGSLPYSLLCK